ncbi:DNA starvation/stationary phase protection protein [Sphaerisporangium melleum]|uniref:DNA starvation/stationary phase protection protein n=1 Tax=Sphaerisporangium melleum TaxID=321316 RepID=A0A917RJR4_9ACTN|nr:DNA starvation/stationary phase protection protein [Sphaerisporangium melleum]GGL09569.1 DNA starvation/stationary phase protection protein [Sphaerisporangium melleum]GII67578.1 DNA starvation/stationary phase protection protein [Sphaerisporangium melleum]
MAQITSPLSGDNQKIAGDALQGALIDLLDLSLVGKQAHWNLIGRNFRSLHLQLDEIVALARTGADAVAERAVALGVNPDGRAATIARDSQVGHLEAGYIEDGKVVAVFTDILCAAVSRMRERIEATEEADPVTQDLLIEVTDGLEKQHWMIQAQR